MKAIIMAGGKGSRLRPLTCDLPKPMVPLLNKPVMEYSIELLKDYGITEIGVTTCYLPEMIEEYFGDGSNWGVHLTYFQEDEPLGTAGSVRNATDFLDETFMVISGDALTDINLKEALEYHRAKGGIGTLVLNQQDVPVDFGVVMTDETGQIIRFLEKPSWGEVFSDLVNTGIYILEPEIFDYYDRGQNFDFSKDLFPLLMENHEALYGFASSGYWSDIGDAEQYMQSQFDLLTGNLNLYIRGQQVEEGIWIGENTEIAPDVELNGPIFIGENVEIKSGALIEAAVIGNHTVIDKGASLKRSILWNGVYVGSYAEIRAGFLCDGVKVKDQVRIFEGAILGKDSTVGHQVTIRPGVKVWPMKIIEDYTRLDRSLVWAPKWRQRIFNTYGVHGLANIEMTPEFLAKLATAYGSIFRKGAEICVSSDYLPASKMLHRAVIAGLLSAGMKVLDLGEITSPIARYSVAALEAEGGLHIRNCYQSPEEIIMEFIDTSGLMIDRGMEREIEKKFFHENFHRADQEHVGEYFYVPQMKESYVEGIFSLLDIDQIRRNQYRVVVDYEFDSLKEVLPVLADRLGCEMESTYNYSRGRQPLSYAERLTTTKRIGQMIHNLGADLGAILDHNGENLTLMTERGEIVTNEELQILQSMVLLYQGIRTLVVPIGAPSFIEELARDYGAEVIRTQNDRALVMRQYYGETAVAGRPFFYPQADGIVSLALILNFMATENVSLEEMLQQIPPFYTFDDSIDCPWEEKGRMMRQLLEEMEGEDVEMVDGVRIHHPHGWTLIYPDRDEPTFHVYTESDDPELASDISQQYVEMLQSYQLV